MNNLLGIAEIHLTLRSENVIVQYLKRGSRRKCIKNFAPIVLFLQKLQHVFFQQDSN